jgi:hypothetical protein
MLSPAFSMGIARSNNVAKIYDGVDYTLSIFSDGKDAGLKGGGIDCMTLADHDYSVEAWAYTRMQSRIRNLGIAPAYHGSWTFALPTNQPGRERWVRMILIEFVEGECMLDLIKRARKRVDDGRGKVDYALLPPEEFRLRVLQNILEAEFTIWWEAGIRSYDVAPRNVTVKPDGNVVLLDYNQVPFRPIEMGHDRYYPGMDPNRLPMSPIEWHWHFPIDDNMWERWFPQEWLDNRELGYEWLILKYRDSPRFKPPSARFLNHYIPARFNGERVQRLLEGLGGKPGEDELYDSEERSSV